MFVKFYCYKNSDYQLINIDEISFINTNPCDMQYGGSGDFIMATFAFNNGLSIDSKIKKEKLKEIEDLLLKA